MSIRHLLFRNENHMVRTARRAIPGFAGPVAREPPARQPEVCRASGLRAYRP